MQFVDLAFGQGDDADASECRLLVEGSDVLLVAREAVQALRQHHLDTAFSDGSQEILISRPQGGRAGERGVGKFMGDTPSLPRRAGMANAQLVIDRCLTLRVTAVAGVECDAHYRGPHIMVRSDAVLCFCNRVK